MVNAFTVRGMLVEKEQQVLLEVAPETFFITALAIMRKAKVGALVVMDQEGSFVGIVTERDYAWKVELEGKAATRTNVAQIMTPAKDVVSVTRFSTLEEALVLMDEHHVRHLPVIEEGKLLGLISIRDVMHGIVKHQIFLAQQFMESTGGRS